MDRSRDEDGIRKRQDDVAWASEKEKEFERKRDGRGKKEMRGLKRGTEKREKEKKKKSVGRAKEKERKGEKRPRQRPTYFAGPMRRRNVAARCSSDLGTKYSAASRQREREAKVARPNRALLRFSCSRAFASERAESWLSVS